jgi:NADPH:quinone reductase-like Zn-dependent oxidoreductase
MAVKLGAHVTVSRSSDKKADALALGADQLQDASRGR